MHALILAAGRGSRFAESKPKCLVEVGGRPLVLHQLEAAKAAGARRVTLVTGHEHELVRAAVGDAAEIVRNARYAETNSLYSFWLARLRVHGDVLVMNCDVLFPHDVLRGLLHRGSALAFDSRSGDSREHVKVSVEDGRLLEMSKELPSQETDGENLGLLHLTEEVARAAFDTAAQLISRGHERAWLGSAINAVARRHAIACVDVAGLPWVEINEPRDLAEARAQVWPAIAQLRSHQATLRARLREQRVMVPSAFDLAMASRTDRLLGDTLDRGGSRVSAISSRAAGRVFPGGGAYESAPVSAVG